MHAAPQPLRILVVEDDPDIREMLIDCLAQEGEVEGAADGQEALERLVEGPLPSVVLLDLRMPRLSGEGVLRAIALLPRCPPVVTMSACTHQAPPGSRAHLVKPFAIEDAVAALRRAVDEAGDVGALPCQASGPAATRPRPPAACASPRAQPPR